MSNAQKVPLTRALSAFATRKARDEIARRGRSLPGTVIDVAGPIVTVNFDVSGATLPNVTMPLFGPEYVRYPIKAGDRGAAFPVDVYLGGVSGLGSGLADTSLRGNLSTLVWFPVGNKGWSDVDPDAVTIYGPNGVVMRDQDSQTVSTLTPNGLVVNAKTSITLAVGSHSIVIDSSGVKIDGKPFLPHEHSGVQTGSGTSGGVA